MKKPESVLFLLDTIYVLNHPMLRGDEPFVIF